MRIYELEVRAAPDAPVQTEYAYKTFAVLARAQYEKMRYIVESMKDVTSEYLCPPSKDGTIEGSVSVLNRDLWRAGWGTVERELICALVKEHIQTRDQWSKGDENPSVKAARLQNNLFEHAYQAYQNYIADETDENKARFKALFGVIIDSGFENDYYHWKEILIEPSWWEQKEVHSRDS